MLYDDHKDIERNIETGETKNKIFFLNAFRMQILNDKGKVNFISIKYYTLLCFPPGTSPSNKHTHIVPVIYIFPFI